MSTTKKACNGSGGRTIYDNIFGGPSNFRVPSLAPQVDDCVEILTGFHIARGGGGSILVLDLLMVEEEDLFLSSSGFDYDEVFGGCGHCFGVPIEELMMDVEAEEEEANGGGGGDSSEEAERCPPRATVGSFEFSVLNSLNSDSKETIF